jgi:hypothetical protein
MPTWIFGENHGNSKNFRSTGNYRLHPGDFSLLAGFHRRGQEIGFLEEFALANDRAAVLKKLVPGTEDYYFFHCLHYQQTEQLDQVDQMLKPWIKRYGYTQQVNQIRNRQALLKYNQDPRSTLEFLTRQLNLNFDHQREIPQTQRDLPSSLDSRLIETNRLIAQAMTRYRNTEGFDDSGLWLLANQNLNKNQLRHLLQRLRVPDYPELVDLIVRDLKERDSQKFGSMQIHGALTLQQLDELAQKFPRVNNTTEFVDIYLKKLRPSNDSNWQVDEKVYQDYLDRLWKFASQLEPTHNSLKACVLFNKLKSAHRQGQHDLQLFLTYLKLPRRAVYVPRQLVEDVRNRNQLADLNRDYSKQIRLVPIRNDEPLVRAYLHHFLLNASDTSEFRPHIESNYLKQQFATVKILNGLGDDEQWASMLAPQEYQELLERVDLDFAPSNP